MSPEWLQFVGSAALMFLVVGVCVRWALRNGLNERIRGRHGADGAATGGGR
jgi:hypothetical protein